MSPKIGYRDDSLFGDAITDPIAVIQHEIQELGNVDIPHAILIFFHDQLTSEELETCNRIYNYQNQGYDMTDADWSILKTAIIRILGNRNFCKWLCDNPSGIYNNYIAPFDDAEERLEEATCYTYIIPDDAICLTIPDDWDGGRLFIWTADKNNTEPIKEIPLKTML